MSAYATLVTTLYAQGATLSLDAASGEMHVHPTPLAQRYREAIRAHLGALLCQAAVDTVERAIHAKALPEDILERALPGRPHLWDLVQTDFTVEQTRRACQQYVAAWLAWLQGPGAEEERKSHE